MNAPTAPDPGSRLRRLFGGLFGGFLGISLLKFGNPPIFESWTTPPANGYELVLNGWPISWGYAALAGLIVLGLFSARWKLSRPPWLLALPLLWLLWEALAATQTLAPALTRVTLAHLAACVICFYCGFFALGDQQELSHFRICLIIAFVLVLAAGLHQHFGGLEETRRYFMLYLYPHQHVPPEYLKRLSSNRIFSTLFYPNALAGAILLLAPPVLGAIAGAKRSFTQGARLFLLAVVGSAACACLFWSGSKGGWLLALLSGVIALLQLPLGNRFRALLLGLVLVGGLTGFILKYSDFFHRGATSVSARFDYWNAALQTVKDRPMFGTGPGTFYVAYERVRRPESEPSRLVHNDYLEQASDSGLPGFVVYTLFIAATLLFGFRSARGNWQAFCLWLGTLGWALQGFLEFGLYIPALAWPAFTLLGWLTRNTAIDIPHPPQYSPPRHENPVPQRT